MNTIAPTVAPGTSGVSRGSAGLIPYATPEHPEHIDLRLDANEGPPSDLDLAELVSQLRADTLRRYPSTVELEAILAARWRVAPDRVIVTSGGDDAIDRACRACLGPDSEMILPTPTFEMIERYARLAGGEVVNVPWWTGPFPARAVLDQVSSRTRLIVVVSPNNPTGAVATREDLCRLTAGAPDAVLLVDLAYGEFADEDLMEVALSLPRAVVIRTFSKAYGLAGLRVGYAVGPADVVRSMRAVGAPYPASALSLVVAADQLHSARARVSRTVRRVRQERQELAALLEGLGARPLPSQANFVLAEFANPDWVWSALRSLGIATRKFTAGSSRLASCLRITCPAEASSFDRLAAGLEAAIRPRAILLDMDGVMADVGASYRTAIMLTAETFGARVSAEEVSAAKLQPNSNNDWVVTQRLLAVRGIDVPLEAVSARFNELYRGSGVPGLEAAERLIPTRQLLEWLAARIPLGIVTGRPRRDAEALVDRFDLRALFKAVVCMEDAPAKPSPVPVVLALRTLGVQHAWMVGDTPDDVRSARAAGVVPLGIAAPSDDPSKTRPQLASAGAARVIDSLNALEELLR